MKYVMLLRGVNVGGQSRVPMLRLREVLTSHGFGDVATYINSGNVVFSSEEVPNEHEIASLLCGEFGFDVSFLILTAAEVVEIADAIPSDWTNDYTDRKADVIYLFDDVNSPEIVERISWRPEFEELRYVPHAVLSRILRKHQPKSSVLKLIGTELYRHMTIRNITTARKLAEMVR
jgi:uncharacterized protein (DUF1697 family)